MTQPVNRKLAVACMLHMAAECGHPFFCLECGVELLPEDQIQFDARQADIHGGVHDYQNVRPIHRACHVGPKGKTARDNAANNKVKRLAGQRKPRFKRLIPARQFQKGVKRPWPKK